MKILQFNKKWYSIFFLIIFLFLLIFFTKIHPIVFFDTDDWLYTSYMRKALPLWGDWNPTRILPETIMPLLSDIGVNVFYPLTNDYIFSLTLIHGLVVSLFITIYIYCFFKLITKKFELNNFISICISILFLMLHFLIFRVATSNNTFMFTTVDACCYYYYVIPALLNCSLVMYFIADDTFSKKKSNFKMSMLVLACYLAILSNLFQSIILAVYIFAKLLIEFLHYSKKRQIIQFIKERIFQFLILVLWFIGQIFELGGGRAKSLTENTTFIENIKNTFANFYNVMLHSNRTFICLFLFSSIILLFILIKNKIYKSDLFKILVISSSITLLYLILVCAVTGPAYITRPDVLFGFIFYIFVFICFVILIIIKKYNFITFLIPLSLFILYYQIDTSDITFKDSNVMNFSYQKCIEINNIIIDQIIKGSKSNDETIIVYFPKFDSFDNFPIANYGANRYSETLYRHGIISRKTNIEPVFSNELYNN